MPKTILIVGGTFSDKSNPDGTYGKPSGLLKKINNAILQNNTQENTDIILFNGGHYSELKQIIAKYVPESDFVFWFANVSNNLPKIRNVKEINPKVMLITSKRNDNEKYNIAELINRALNAKANLLFEFSKTNTNLFNIRILDPLGCMWYNGTDIETAVSQALNRLNFLSKITRQGTINDDTNNDAIARMYFDNVFSNNPSEKSPSLHALGLSTAQMDESIRLSFGRYSTLEDADAFVDAVVKILPMLRRFRRK